MKTSIENTERKTLIVKPELCIGCRTCELACAFSHQVDGEFRPSKPRITVRKTGIDRYVPLLCLQCLEPACVAACKFGALYKDEETGTVEYDPDKCTGCHACVAACPFGNITIAEDDFGVLKCDLCGGDPMCAKFCPTSALTAVRY